ncbi:putative short-chain dehydrogenase [Cryphonectria parasitica EP155]|uniref:Short-chain dehydrogenase n=1 Tax=Cryphonectria parasitica (strain ATCC 38755 / EP155) TaxID=660469 RepID=A0A9P5CVK1_CRYP1|nr:putative short-chain dehydrogenase [Cryphonectria parasitica EP155]KAF3771407.1 putative short-chain dehydrogenase [Cryphonectria parasitica EP155]
MGQPTIPPTPPDIDLSGKTIIITGGNSGVGFRATREFLVLGASRLILAVRSPARGHDAVSALMADPAVKEVNPEAVVEAFELDLDDYKSGERFCQRVKSEVKELDVLVNNAGIVDLKYHKSMSGHERTFQVHCYTHLLISLSLLPLLRRTARLRNQPTHISWVSSGTSATHSFAKRPIPAGSSVLAHLDDELNFDYMTRYSDNKFVANLLVRRLAAAVSPSEVIINSFCPGFLKPTGIDKSLPSWLGLVIGMTRRFKGRDVDGGARTFVYAAAVANQKTHGKFLQHNQVDDKACAWLDEAIGQDFSDRLWVEIMADMSRIDPDLSSLA